MERLNHIKDVLITEIEAQMENLQCVDAKELGEVIDMVKDIEETIYYYTVTEAMHGKEYKYGEWNKPVEHKEEHEGKSPKSRKSYMESKLMHHDRSSQMQVLEQYLKELSQDVLEMISGSSLEEKQLLKTKLTTLVSKIDQA